MEWQRGETAAPNAEAEDLRTALLLEDLRGWEEHEEGDATRFVFYCPRTDDVEVRMRAIETRLARPVRWEGVDEEDWAHAWKRFWKPQRIGERIVVKPTWESFEAGPDDVVIELDPGMAFGTGTHATTRMCLEWLERLVEGGEQMLDVGTGSGLLAIAGVRLGASAALAVDNDPVAVRTAAENVALNGVAPQVRVESSDLTEVLAPDARFDLVVANIVADAIISLAPRLAPYLAEGGAFVASGIIIERLEDVRAALGEVGFDKMEWRVDGEWASVCAARED